MKVPILAALLVLAGCSTTYTEPTLPADHPASATAAEASPASRSRTLELVATESVEPTESTTQAKHAGHDMPTAPTRSSSGEAEHKHMASTAARKLAGDGVTYACPMHPEVTSNKPDQRCPKCGMKLVKAKGGKQP